MDRTDNRPALTLHPEWAYAVAVLGKRLENRTWPPPDRLIGKRLAIHGGAAVGGRSHGKGPKVSMYHAEAIQDMFAMARKAGADLAHPITFRDICERGQGIIAVVKVTGYIEGPSDAPWYIGPETTDDHGNAVPNYGWQFADVQVLPVPVKCKGAQGLWTLPLDVLAAVRSQLAEVPHA